MKIIFILVSFLKNENQITNDFRKIEFKFKYNKSNKK